jgi:pSer/pThr/pTyr-binding forkhead associated (FHA) protein
LLNLVIESPLLLIIPLLLIAVILIIIMMLRPRKKRGGESGSSDTSGSGDAARKGTAELVRVPSLTYLSDSGPGISVTLKGGPLAIGRAADNDVVIDDRFSGYETVGDVHARLYQRAGYWIIKDLGSETGVYVNRQRTGHNILQEGWQVSIGSVTFEFHTEKKGAAA